MFGNGGVVSKLFVNADRAGILGVLFRRRCFLGIGIASGNSLAGGFNDRVDDRAGTTPGGINLPVIVFHADIKPLGCGTQSLLHFLGQLLDFGLTLLQATDQ